MTWLHGGLKNAGTLSYIQKYTNLLSPDFFRPSCSQAIKKIVFNARNSAGPKFSSQNSLKELKNLNKDDPYIKWTEIYFNKGD